MAKAKNTYGLIGNKLKHTFSEKHFSEKFTKEKITDSEYKNFVLEDISEFKDLLKKEKTLKGLNVTAPYKQEIIPYLDELSHEAEKIGAVNTIAFVGGKLIGYNTDIVGFEESIKPFLNSKHKKAVIFGNGGAAKAAAYVFKGLKIHYKIISRKGTKKTFANVNKSFLREHQILVNTTPLGSFPKIDECVPINYFGLTAYHIAFDMVYNPEETLFLQKAKKQGAKIKNGLEMLALQAEASWKIWNS